MSNAQAHARYKESTPAKGAVLSAAPSQVSITFTQDVQKVSGTYGIEVTDASGASVTDGAATLDDADRTKMSVPLRATLPDGRYEVHWKNVSDADGDPAEGAFSFYVGLQPTAEDLAADEALALLGEEDETPQATEDASTPAPGETPAASATAVASSSDDGGGGNSPLFIIAVIVIAGIVAGFIGARLVTRPRS